MQDLIALLQQSIGSIGPDVAAIKQNIMASCSMEGDIVRAIEARVKAEQSRVDYRAFCDEVDAIRESHHA